jgi:hypothetical protein
MNAQHTSRTQATPNLSEKCFRGAGKLPLRFLTPCRGALSCCLARFLMARPSKQKIVGLRRPTIAEEFGLALYICIGSDTGTTSPFQPSAGLTSERRHFTWSLDDPQDRHIGRPFIAAHLVLRLLPLGS